MSCSYRGAARIKTVTVLGAGVIGSGWVATFLAAGLRVRVFDPSMDVSSKVSDWVRAAWPRMEALGLVCAVADPATLTFHSSVRDAVTSADFVQESTPERIDAKKALFQVLDALVPTDVLIATSTSSLPVTQLQGPCTHPERFVLGHPFNPVHLMPLVEVGGGRGTDALAIEAAQAFYQTLGKECVRLHREAFGHIANRLTSAMFREAVSLVTEGYATVADVDRAIRFGPALKWAVQGQFSTFDINGGASGFEGFLHHFAPGIVKRWSSMQTPDLLDAEVQRNLTLQVEKARESRSLSVLTDRQDRLVVALLQALRGDEAGAEK